MCTSVLPTKSPQQEPPFARNLVGFAVKDQLFHISIKDKPSFSAYTGVFAIILSMVLFITLYFSCSQEFTLVYLTFINSNFVLTTIVTSIVFGVVVALIVWIILQFPCFNPKIQMNIPESSYHKTSASVFVGQPHVIDCEEEESKSSDMDKVLLEARTYVESRVRIIMDNFNARSNVVKDMCNTEIAQLKGASLSAGSDVSSEMNKDRIAVLEGIIDNIDKIWQDCYKAISTSVHENEAPISGTIQKLPSMSSEAVLLIFFNQLTQIEQKILAL